MIYIQHILLFKVCLCARACSFLSLFVLFYLSYFCVGFVIIAVVVFAFECQRACLCEKLRKEVVS